MTVQAQTVDVPAAPGLSRKDLLITLLIVALGAVFLLLGGFSAETGDRSVFTDETLGTLVSLPSQATLYTIGVLCLFIAGMERGHDPTDQAGPQQAHPQVIKDAGKGYPHECAPEHHALNGNVDYARSLA